MEGRVENCGTGTSMAFDSELGQLCVYTSSKPAYNLGCCRLICSAHLTLMKKHDATMEQAKCTLSANLTPTRRVDGSLECGVLLTCFASCSAGFRITMRRHPMTSTTDGLCLLELAPQQCAVPFLNTAHVWPPPALMLLTLPSPATATGVVLNSMSTPGTPS